MRRKLNKILLGIGATVTGLAVYTATAYAVTKKFVKFALDRESPKTSEKSKKKISRTVIDPELMQKVQEKAEELKNSGCEVIEITGLDNEKLIGHFYRNENTDRIILAMHGWRTSWTRDFGVISEFWHKNNCSVLYVEQRGQNNSGGQYIGFGMLERYDCVEWLKWISENFSSDIPVYLAGISMGAATVLMASGLKLPLRVCGIMADSGYTSPHAIWKYVTENNLRLSYGMVGLLADDICRRKINMGTKDCSTVDALKKNKIPVLFVHGTADRFVPVEMTYENYMACAAPKELLIVPGAEHAKSYLLEKEKYEEAVKVFWNKYDKKINPNHN